MIINGLRSIANAKQSYAETRNYLGKGEVESSILSCSTSYFNDLEGYRCCP
jgi:hypothetical protein